MDKSRPMRILFAVSKLEAVADANCAIALRIAGELAARFGCMCDIAGVASSPVDPETRADGAVRLIRRCCPDTHSDERDRLHSEFAAYCHKSDRGGAAAKALYALSHPIRSLRLNYLNTTAQKKMREERILEYRKLVRGLLGETLYDAVIAVYNPFEPNEWLFGEPGLPPLFIYQLDPWALNELLPDGVAERTQQELKAFESARHIFTTAPLYKQYHAEPFSRYLDRMTVLGFPNFVPNSEPAPDETFIGHDGDYINVLYCGILEDTYRDPREVLSSLMRVCSGRVRVYLVGRCISRSAEALAAKYPERIILLPPTAPELCREAMRDADFLLNVSNTLTNQMPSKLIDYFSIGKPVISTRKLENCPCIPYLERYPLAHSYDELEPVADREEKLERFITDNLGKRLSGEELEELFPECRPDYCADRIFEKIIAEE